MSVQTPADRTPEAVGLREVIGSDEMERGIAGSENLNEVEVLVGLQGERDLAMAGKYSARSGAQTLCARSC